MQVLIACEFSGVVRDAFIEAGHDAVSCDILPSEARGPHIQDDVRNYLRLGWDLMIAFPPCTHLCSSGARWWSGKVGEQGEAVEFVKELLCAPIPMIALENPVGILSRVIRKPDQIVQPWMFGHGETKSTCFWLKGLSRLSSTLVVPGRAHRIHEMGPSANRGRIRSRTYIGIAEAMASQWGKRCRPLS